MAPFEKPRIVMEQSPWQTFFESLPGMLATFQGTKQQAIEAQKDRDWRASEAAKSREWEESVLYLKDKLTDQNIAQEQNFELRGIARKLGVLKPHDKTGPSGEIIEDSFARLQDYNADIESDLNLYYTGLNMGNDLDRDKSGILEDYEVEPYLANAFPQGDVPEALEKGLKAWTLAPDRRLALETERITQQLSEQELKERRERYKFLPEALRQEAETRDVSILTLQQELEEKKTRYEALPKTLEQEQELRDIELKLKEQILEKGTYEIDLLDFSLEEAMLRQNQMRQDYALGVVRLQAGEKQLDAATLQLDSAQFEQDLKVREYVIKTTGEALVGNLEAQTGIAAGIMSNIKFKDKGGKLIPIMTLLTEADLNTKNKLEKSVRQSTYSTHIKTDILDLMEAYYLGKGEDQIADYSLILDEVGKIQKLDDFYQEWAGRHSMELATYAVAEGWDSLDNFMKRLRAHNTMAMADLKNFANMYGSPYDVDKILRAIEWDQTGIFDNIKALDDAKNAKDQFKHLSSILEQAQAQNLSSALMGAQGTYSTKDSSAILAPFDIMPLRSERVIDDIFDLNEPDE